jgi:heat-inducible transcriptional repressor
LAQRTKTLAVTTTDEGGIYYAGVANILSMSEFYDIDLTKTILTLLDEVEHWKHVLERAMHESEQTQVLLGEDLGESYLAPFGGVFSTFHLPNDHTAAIGVIGPARLNYPYIVPIVGYVGHLLDDMVGSW